ncbi:ABC transporter ATP-binding protein [Microbacterium xylanilyticum]
MIRLWRTLRQVLTVFPPGARRFFVTHSILAGLLAVLDVAALSAMAIVLAALVSQTGIGGSALGGVLETARIPVLAAVCGLFLVKSVLGALLHHHATRRFADYEFELGGRVFAAYAHAPWDKRAQVSTAEITRIVDSSVALTTTGFVIPLMQITGHAITAFGVLAVIVVAQPATAVIAVVYFAGVFYLLSRFVARHLRAAGQQNRHLSFRVAVIMSEIVDTLRELTLRQTLDEAGGEVARQRRIVTKARGTMAFFGTLPKYALEAALVGGIVFVGGGAYLIGGDQAAIMAIAMFGASAFRLIPSIIGIQSSLNQAQMNEAFAQDLVSGIDDAGHWMSQSEVRELDRSTFPERPRSLVLEQVRYRYSGASEDVLKGISLEIPVGSRCAIVGPSGSGKSTMIDVILGLSEPSEGTVRLDRTDIADVLGAWHSRVGYVPQRVALFDASIAQNVALTWGQDIDLARVEWALEKAQLGDLLSRPDGVHAHVGERGASLSGGQQQRLGIARALYSDPLVLVLDEATSSLDTATESQVMAALNALAGSVTVITVAHRLATIKDYDQICYVSEGRLVKAGTFDDVVRTVEDFATQVDLAGLRQER